MDYEAMPTLQVSGLILLLLSVRVVFGDDCKTVVTLSRHPEKEGFHRLLHSVVTIETNESALFSDCVLAQRELIPAGLYVNPDELADLQRKGQVLTSVDQNIDVEASKENSVPFDVFVYYELKKMGENLSGSFVLPFHLRYHQPLPSGGEQEVSVDAPLLLLRCKRVPQCLEESQLVRAPCIPGGLKQCIWHSIPFSSPVLPTFSLKVPVGNVNHYTGVAICTLLTTFSGSLYVIYELYRHHWR